MKTLIEIIDNSQECKEFSLLVDKVVNNYIFKYNNDNEFAEHNDDIDLQKSNTTDDMEYIDSIYFSKTIPIIIFKIKNKTGIKKSFNKRKLKLDSFPILILQDDNGYLIKIHYGIMSEKELSEFILYDNYFLSSKDISQINYIIAAKTLADAAYKIYDNDTADNEEISESSEFGVYTDDGDAINDAGEYVDDEDW